MTPREIAFRAAVMAAVANHALELKTYYRSELAEPGVMTNGEKLVPVDPDHPERKIGKVIKQDAKPKAAISDRAAFTRWMVHRYDGDPKGYVQTTVGPDPAKAAQVVNVLRAHAPHLLLETRAVPGWAEAEVLRRTLEAGEPCSPTGELGVPGVEYVPASEGTVAVTPDKGALEVIMHMVAEGRLDIRTGKPLAIEVGRDAVD